MTAQTDDSKHALLRRQLTDVLATLGQELLPADRAIADFFLSTDRHISVAQLHGELVAEQPELDMSQVRRCLHFLCELGIARPVKLDDRTVYEHLHPHEHHDHLLCMRCGAIEEFVSEALEAEQLSACRQHAFQPLMHTLIIRGICERCLKRIPTTRNLASCLAGETVVIAELTGGVQLNQRLRDLGFLRGREVKVLQNDGPVALELNDSRLAIGRGEAANILVHRPEPST